jgi:Lysyl oxidase
MARMFRTAAVGASVVALAATVNAPAAGARPAGERPALDLVATTSAVTAQRVAGSSRVDLDLGAFVVAGRSPFEVRVTRRSYHDPIVADQVVGTRDHRSLGVVDNFAYLDGFLHLTLTDVAGQQVRSVDQDFCPDGYAVRLRPDGADTSPYPVGCPRNPFILGYVWGIQAGWGASTHDRLQPVDTTGLPDGVYTAREEVSERYRKAFRIPATAVTVQVTLTTVARPPAPARRPAMPDTGAAAAPAGPARVPDADRPDLVALPAWAVDVVGDNPTTPEVEPERLSFAAAVWNAGPSPFVVAGFRRPDEAVMDSYQYFYDSKGQRVGYAPVGTMEWDPQPEHHHWHFADFAGYRLLDSAKHEVVRSRKEAFCVASPDPINLFVRNAVWQPENTDLHTACGKEDSLTVQEVLATGHGDTYLNFVPGRALDIHDLPNGTYYIEVAANPKHLLYETDLSNDVALRKVILGGTPGARTVHVPPYQLIDTDP